MLPRAPDQGVDMKFFSSGKAVDLQVEQVYVAGWTGRNRVAVDQHIEELAELGIKPPSKVPLYYRVSNGLLTQSAQIDVLGTSTSGEVEPLIIQHGTKLWIGLASDHTDRELEAYSVAASKQACPKPVSPELWEYDSVKDHLDLLILRCKIKESGHWIVYQEGSLDSIRPLSELMTGSEFGQNDAMLCGTLPAVGGVRPANDYTMELVDPVLNRTIQLSYSVTSLPIVA